MSWIRRIGAVLTMLTALAIGAAQLGGVGADTLTAAPGGSVSTNVGSANDIVGLFNAAAS
jgi:hypothetical protein